MSFAAVLKPNEKVNERTLLTLIGGWIVFLLLFWQVVVPHMSPLIPNPVEVTKAAGLQWRQGAVYQLVSSTIVSLTSIALASTLGLGLSYLSTIPLFRAPVRWIGSLRVLSLTGITIIFVLATPNGYWLKVGTLTFAIMVFLVNNMLQVIDDIPQSKFEYARTLNMNRWQVLREVVIRGTLASAFDTIRMNAAMAWMMLTMVETMSRADGGIGVVLVELARQSNYASIFAIQIMIFLVGLGQDRLIQFAKLQACPYTRGQ